MKRKRRASIACIATWILITGCNRESQSATTAVSGSTASAGKARSDTTATTGKPKAKPADPSDPSPDPITHPCVVKAAQFDIELAKNLNSCSTDAECDCFPGGVTDKAGCGGVRSKASAKKLHDINAEFGKMKCKLAQECGAQECKPKCDNGQCR